MATPSKGIRVTRRRAEEIERLVAVEVTRLEARSEALERRLVVVERRAVLGETLARARITAELGVIQQLKEAST